MAGIAPLPVNGAVFPDQRSAGRALRVTWHPEIDAAVVSIWRDDACVATAQVAASDVARLVHTLVDGLAGSTITGQQQLA
ncbi:MAG: hypothetical protein QOJ03_899 [Frankiaceae bacterium]|jgi:hypothetical protein|nr:hypothetical protein [Frankiaceae bacterium]